MDRDYEYEIDLVWLIKKMFRFVWLMILAALVGAVVGFVTTPEATAPVHTAFVSIYLQHEDPELEQAKLSNEITNCILLLKGKDQQTELIEIAGLAAGKSQADASVEINSAGGNMITYTLKSGDKDMIESLTDAVKELVSQQVPQLVPEFNARVIDSGVTINQPVEPSAKKNVVLGALVGFVLVVGVVGVCALLDGHVHGVGDLQCGNKTPILAEIPEVTTDIFGISKKAVSPETGAESYRQLRATLAGCTHEVEGCRTVGIAGAAAGEDAANIAVGLAKALHAVGQRVCVLEADLRRSVLAQKLQLAGAVGMEDVLQGAVSVEQALQPVDGKADCMAVAVVNAVAQPGDLLLGQQMAAMLDQLKNSFDYVLVALPPVSSVSDAQSLAPSLTGLVLAVRREHTLRKDLQEALRRLRLSCARVLGFVLTNA